MIRASATSSRQATPYRTASAVYTGAPASTEETATLPPTQTMAAEPAATPTPRRGAAGRGPARLDAVGLGRLGAGEAPVAGSGGVGGA